jgi:hypothetical protein
LPRLSYFHGIAIYMYYSDENPPHFHARYGEHEARIAIATGTVLHGSLPPGSLRLVRTWVELHRADLVVCWQRAVNGLGPGTIEPLA